MRNTVSVPRVLLIGAIPPPSGGDSTWTLKYINYCKEHQYEYRHVNTAIIGERGTDLSKGINILDEVKRSFTIWKQVIYELKEYKPNIVHMNTNCSARGIYRDLMTVLLVKKFKRNVIVHCRCNVGYELGNRKIAINMARFMMKKSSAVFVQNKFSYKYVHEVLRQSKDKIYQIPNYIERKEIVEKKQINQELKRIVYTGHIVSYKGVSEIIECACHFPQIEFEMVGLVTDEYGDFKEIEKKITNIKFIGDVDCQEVKKYLDAADMFMLVSWSEGFSNSLCEAMARGLPCIVSDVGANEEMIENLGGFVCKSRNVTQMLEAIEKCKDKAVREKQSEWNIRKVREYYCMDRVINNIREIYARYLR